MPIPTLTVVDEWPTRKLPQSTFDTAVRTSMNQMNTMVSELNSDVIPGINAVTDNVNTVVENLAAIQAAPTNAISVANSAIAAAGSATSAAESAAESAAAAATAAAVTGLPIITSVDSGKAIVVKPDASGWELSLIKSCTGGGGSVKQTISSNLTLTVDSPRKMVLGATVYGLKVIMPLATTLEQDGVSFIIANNGAYPIQVVDHDNHTLGADFGSIPANSARGFVLVDKAAGTWVILNLVSASLGGRIGEAGVILDTHQPVVFESASTNYISAVSLSDTKVLVAYQDQGNSSYGTAIVLTIDGTGITVGTPVVFESASTNYISAVSLSE